MWGSTNKRMVVRRKTPDEDTAEDIRRNPKRAKLHKTFVVPFELLKEAVSSPQEFLPVVPETAAAVVPGPVAAAAAAPDPGTAAGPGPEVCNRGTVTDTTGTVRGGAPGDEDEGTERGGAPRDEGPVPPDRRFGIHSELFLRDCYAEMIEEIAKNSPETFFDTKSRMLLEIRGSSGIGKSTFLALCMSELRSQGMEDFAVFHAPKTHTTEKVYEIECSIWNKGQLVHEKLPLNDAREVLVKQGGMKELLYIFCDGCAPAINLEDFEGIVIVAVSPSVSTAALQGQIVHNIISLVMPPWTLSELKRLGRMLGIPEKEIENNHFHMNGIVRYALCPGGAKDKVDRAVNSVDPRAISHLVATDITDKQTEMNMVHSLVLWKTEKPTASEQGKYNLRGNVTFSLVSSYAAKAVAQKLALSDIARVKECLRDLSPVTGAEGYRGALFEAYAIKSFRNGGRFQIMKNEDGEKLQPVKNLTVPPLDDENVIIMPNNGLSTRSLPLKNLLKKKALHQLRQNKYQPRLVWPKTTNFPTFDAFYLDEKGEMYSLQMTVAEENSHLRHDLNNSGAHQTKVYLEKLEEETVGKKAPPKAAVAKKATRKSSRNKRKSDASEALQKKKKFKAIFVTPGADRKCWPKKQKFTGTVKVGKKTWSEEEAATQMEDAFDQCVIRLE